MIGWKEYEMEVMRDCADNAVIVCSIENFDPMGVHTGDSITVAPAQTLTDKEYQRMRDASLAILRKIGVETGGSNVQFAVNPKTGRMIVIEMNPRVSRSSALASKATGFPIAKIAAKLAVGFRLDEIRNDITRETPACFEPTIDYVVTKVPRWAFEKFPEADPVLTTQMKSVGEVMAIGRTFRESLPEGPARAWRSAGSASAATRRTSGAPPTQPTEDEIKAKLATPNAERVWYIRYALLAGHDASSEIHDADRASTRGSSHNLASWSLIEGRLRAGRAAWSGPATTCSARPSGTGSPTGSSPTSGASARSRSAATASGAGSRPSSSWSTPARPSSRRSRPITTRPTRTRTRRGVGDKPRVVILGGGPNRIGQGIEFDYCCCQAAFALQADGYEVVMVNSNPETVSTDYDTSDRLFFEPLTVEDVLNICERVQPMGVIVQFGGQTPLNLAQGPGGGGGADHRHEPREHRPGRGPRAVPRGHRPARPEADAQRLGDPLRGGAADRRADRLPGRRPARASCWGAGRMEIVYDEREPGPLHGRGRRGQPRAPRPDRQVPGRRQRGRRRRRLRRRRARSSAA